MKTIVVTESMKERAEGVKGFWKDEGEGYFSMIGNVFSQVAYIKIPDAHPLAGLNYIHESFYDIKVNGGLTFGEGCIFGWDYGHAYNDFDIQKHIKNAIKFFKQKEKE